VKLLALLGPTASGKTRMGVEVALALHGEGHRVEIVSCDSMGVYRGLDIAADKPDAAQRRGVPHHLFDIVEAHETFTAVEYRRHARRTIADVHARGGIPMLVGGSGLYFRAVVDDLEFAPTDPAVRERLEASDPHALYERLRAADPESAARIDPRNVRRVVRAVEILELTGRAPTELRGSWDHREGPYAVAAAALRWDREVLYARAAERVHRELAAGLVAEVQRVRPGGISRTAEQALGVKEILEHLSGRLTIKEATELLVRNTKNFVRRQLAWFRADPRITWVDASALGWDGARDALVAHYREGLSVTSSSGPTRTTRP
jgi:tRNA dimethylallyltransferase